MFTETNNEPGTSTHSYSDDEDGDQSFQDSESKLSFDIMQTKIMDTTTIVFSFSLSRYTHGTKWYLQCVRLFSIGFASAHGKP